MSVGLEQASRSRYQIRLARESNRYARWRRQSWHKRALHKRQLSKGCTYTPPASMGPTAPQGPLKGLRWPRTGANTRIFYLLLHVPSYRCVLDSFQLPAHLFIFAAGARPE